MEATLGYLFKKKYINYNEKNYEIFKFKDVVLGIAFTNTNHNQIFNVSTGDSIGIYASVLNEMGNEIEDVVVLKDVDTAMKSNGNEVDFIALRKKIINGTSKYYVRSSNPNSLSVLLDKNLISMADKEFNEKASDFDEDSFEKSTDISNMYSSIKKTIVSQDEQIMQILTALFKNQKVVSSDLDIDLMAKLKENLLIYGSTGTGKTEILKRISRIYKIPIVIEDATSLSETGYVGRKIPDMLEDLYSAANGDKALAEKGILVIDEFDKLAEGGREDHVSRLGVQRSLLKLLDGTQFYFDNKEFNTSKLTIVALGAFTGIADGDNYRHLTTEDFIKYGIMRELVGRFSKNIAMNPLTKDDIAKILVESDFSPLNTYQKLFETMNIGFQYNDEFVNWLAEKAVKLNSGARSLKTVFDNCISGAMFKIFAGEYSNISLVKPESEEDRPYVLTKK